VHGVDPIDELRRILREVGRRPVGSLVQVAIVTGALIDDASINIT
jgi:hypothetical protein